MAAWGWAAVLSWHGHGHKDLALGMSSAVISPCCEAGSVNKAGCRPGSGRN